jgi:hypothetical protein
VGEYSIEVRNHTNGLTIPDTADANYKVISELGYSHKAYGDRNISSQNVTQCYFNKSEDATKGYLGLEHDNILELAFWQHAINNYELVKPPLDPSVYNFSIDTPVAGLRALTTYRT